METLIKDIRYGLRQMRLSPGFTVASILTLALGIGGATTTFSAINALYLRPIAVSDPHTLVSLVATDRRGTESRLFDYSLYREFLSATAPGGLGAHSSARFGFAGNESASVVVGEYASASYFSVLRPRPALGRFFTDEDDSPGAPAVAVLAYDFWRRRFAGDSGIIGKSVAVNGIPTIVVGVAGQGFNGANRAIAPEVWVPLELYPRFARNTPPGFGNLAIVQIIGRVGPDSPARLRSALQSRLQSAPQGFGPMGRVESVRIVPLGGLPGGGNTRGMSPLRLRFFTACLMLFIACINVAGMLIARSTVRRREIAIRLAVGAQRKRVVRQLATESTILFLFGALGGVVVTMLGGGLWSNAVVRSDVPVRVTLDYSVDIRVLAFAILLALATSLVFGLIPAVRATRPDLVPALSDSAGVTPHSSRTRDALVVGQVAASLFLLVCAGLLVRALQQASNIDPGFRPDGVVTASVDLDLIGYQPARGQAFYREILERLQALPEVESASISSSIPFGVTSVTQPVRVGGFESADESGTSIVETSQVSAEYFETLGIPLLRGRRFNEGDRAGAPLVAIVSLPMAERFWPGKDPVGQTFHSGPREFRVVGVVRGIQRSRLGEGPRVHLYVSSEQGYTANATLLVRTRGSAEGAIAALRHEVRELDPAVPVARASTMRELLDDSIAGERFSAKVIGAFALLSLLLAATGLYGSVAYLVVQRTREIGVRMALGARPADVATLVVGKGLRLALAGIVAGLLAALGFTHLLSSRLYGVSALDPTAFAAVSVLLLGVALCASLIPARRAARMDAFSALHGR
jgi:predicted permease